MPKIIKPATGAFTVASLSIDSSGRVFSASSGTAGGGNMVPTFAEYGPGTGTYTIDMGDPAATNTWPPTRMEFNMKDQMARNQIDALVKEMDEMKEEIKELRK